MIEVKKCRPTVITCDPQEKLSSDAKHKFETSKLYLMTDPDGAEFGVVICPTHQLPIHVELAHCSGAR